MKTTLFTFFFLSTFFLFAQDKEEIALQKLDSFFQVKSTDYRSFNEIILNYDQKIEFIGQLEKKLVRNNYPAGKIFIDNIYGNYFRNHNEYSKSLEFHKNALELAQKNKLKEAEIYTLNMIGVVYRRQDLVTQALNHHHSALELAEKYNGNSEFVNVNVAIALNGIGNSYLILEEFESARKQFERSLILEKENNNLLGLAINYQNIGFTYEATDSLEKALENYKISLEYNDKLNSDLGRMICYNSIAQVYLKQGKSDEALPLVNKAENITKVIGDNFYTSGSYINKGWVLIEQEKYKDAERYLNLGLQHAQMNNVQSQEAEAFRLLSLLGEKKGNFSEALNFERKYQQKNSDILNEKNLRIKNELEIKYESEQKSKQIDVLEEEKADFQSRLSKNLTITYLLLGVLGLLAIVGFLVWRQFKLKKEKELITLEQKALRAQMNPHFIFNVLNSIKHYIINNEPKAAAMYLNKFAKLIRGILKLSDSQDISLKEELDTMQSYLMIENIRFGETIHFDVDVDQSINQEEMRIPSLLLQPYLENAIWHGLASKKGDKNIFLEVTNNSADYVKIKISDNGIGRKASAEIKQKQTIHEKSMGLDITEQRLKNYYRNYKKEAQVLFIDLIKNNQPIGTEVIINIPVR